MVANDIGPQYERNLPDVPGRRLGRLALELEAWPLFAFARLLWVIRSDAHPAPLIGVEFVREVVSEEHRGRTSSWALMSKNDGSWPLGLTHFDKSHRYWRIFSGEPAEAKSQELVEQTFLEVHVFAARVGSEHTCQGDALCAVERYARLTQIVPRHHASLRA